MLAARRASASGCDHRLAQRLGQHFVDTPPVDVNHFEPPAAELKRVPEPRKAPEPHQCEAGNGVVVAPCGQGELQQLGHVVRRPERRAPAPGSQTAIINGDNASNQLNGTKLADQIFGLGGNDRLIG